MSNNLKIVAPATDPLASDVNQVAMVLSGLVDVGQLSLCPPQSTPSVPTLAVGGTGNPNGSYYYKVILITGLIQSDGSFYVNGFAPSGDSAQITVTNSQVNLTNIAVGGAGTIARAIYRTAAGGATGTEKFITILYDNTTTTYTDNIADSSLGIGIPTSTSNTAFYGTFIPSSTPTSNTTGTTFAVNPLVNNYGVTTGTNTYTVSVSPAPSAYVDGLPITVKIGSTNTGASTINVNNLGAKNIYDELGIPMSPGTLAANGTYNLVYSSYYGGFIVANLIQTKFNSCSETLITSTSAINVISYTPTIQRNFEIKSYLRVVSAATNITITVTYTDAGGSQTITLFTGTALVGSYMLPTCFFNSAVNQAITLTVTAGTANQVYVSSSIVGV